MVAPGLATLKIAHFSGKRKPFPGWKGFVLSTLNATFTLSAAALAYLRQGLRPIPIRADKTPAVPWGAFRVHPPARRDLRAWFVEQQHPAIGLLTGQLTGLIVLDFDRPALYDTFRQQHPELARTFTVATPRGVHLWFHLPPSRQLPSRRAPGVDLLSDGRYAIAPPSRVHTGSYAVTDDTPPRFLDLPSIAALNAFLDNPRQQSVVSAPAPSAPATPAAHRWAPEDLQRAYCQHAPQSGRNNALFAAACLARDRGWRAAAVHAALADLHARQPAPPGHAREPFARRRREAERTIASAFSRPPRLTSAVRARVARQLPNSVREALVAAGQTHTVRVLEGLRLQGVAPGQTFSYSQARALLAGSVGDWSVRAALHATTPAGAPLLAPLGAGGAYAVEPTSQTDQERCTLEPPHDQRKIGRGRPPTLYTMPSNADLCAALGVSATFSDP